MANNSRPAGAYWLKIVPPLLLVIAVGLPCVLCAAPPERSKTADGRPTDTSQRLRQGIGYLRDLESRLLPPVLVDGEPAHDSLPAYYWAENQALLARFCAMAERRNSASHRPVRSLTLIAGAPGVGKTFLKSRIAADEARQLKVCKVDLPVVYRAMQKDGLVELSPDLAAGDLVLNRMLRLRKPRGAQLTNYLPTLDADCYIIDSLDEVHGEDYVTILKQLEHFVAHAQRDFLHVVVFGRCFAFRDFWQQQQAEQEEDADIQLFVLSPPRLRTTGDLLVSSLNYYSWAHRLRWSPSGGEEQPLDLDTFGKWAAGGFRRSGPFRSVSTASANVPQPRAHERLLRWSRESRVVCGTLYNLAGNGMTREIAAHFSDASFHEPTFMRSYLAAWMIRESSVDGRPSAALPGSADLYLELLERVAVDALAQGRVDRDGYFSVTDEQQITTITRGGQSFHFPTRTILEHSGLIWLDPKLAGEVPRYRFEPFWFHRLLVEMHLARHRQVAVSK